MDNAYGLHALPALIVECIALYIPKTEPTPKMALFDPSHSDDGADKALLPLMGVSRKLRTIVAPLFYKSATKIVGITERSQYSHIAPSNVFSLDQIVKMGTQAYVKQLRITLDVYALEECILEDANHVRDVVVPSIKKCGVLLAASTLHLYICKNNCLRFEAEMKRRHALDHPDDPANKDPAAIDMPKELDAVKRAVFDVVPRVRRVIANMDDHATYGPSAHDRMRFREVVGFMEDSVGGLALGHVSVIKSPVSKKLLANLSGLGMALRSITLSHNKGSQQHIELVRRNWMRLERLHIDHPTAHAVVKMTCCDSGSDTLVYPQLKYLCLNVCSGNREDSHWQPTTDPFPALTTLISRGRFPFTTPVVLTEGSKHIRRLDLDLDNDPMAAYGNDLFCDMSFRELESVSLGWWARGEARAARSQILFTRALNIGLRTQVAHIHCLEMGWLDNATFKDMHALSTLRVLDLELTYITPAQAMTVFNACPVLQRAYISLHDEGQGNRDAKMPTDIELLGFQEAHESCKSRIQSLGIYSTQFSRLRRAAEYIVLLVAVLPHLKRVCISSFDRIMTNKYIPDRTSSMKLINAIDQTRKRSFYEKNTKVHSVDVAIDNCW